MTMEEDDDDDVPTDEVCFTLTNKLTINYLLFPPKAVIRNISILLIS